MKATKPWNNRRFIGTFDVENTTKGDSGRYRCIVHSDKGVGVSNYGELTIKREYWAQSMWTPQPQYSRDVCHPHDLQVHGKVNRKCCTSSKAILKIPAFYVDLLCAVLDQAQSHLKDHEGKRHQVYSNLTDISLLQSFDMNLWSHPKLNPARPHFPTAP